MTAHNKKHKRDKMITFLTTKPFYDRMKKVVDDAPEDDELRNMSDFLRVATKKEVKRREGV